ncbi:MAG: hypothetical protein ABEJ79_01530 [Halolamina sp.]
MAAASMPPTEEARAVFRRLGYAVDGDGTRFVAERKWRRVRVLALCAEDATDPGAAVDDDDADLHCFVTWRECAADLREAMRGLDVDGEWAVVGVDDDGDHEVVVEPRRSS